MIFRGRRPLLVGCSTGVLVGLLIYVGALEPLESTALDQLFELRGSRAPQSPIIIVAIDQASIETIGHSWPLPRSLHAKLLDRLVAVSAVAVGFDILFLFPSSPTEDEALGRAVATAGNVVLAATRSTTTEGSILKLSFDLPVSVIARDSAKVGLVEGSVSPNGSVQRTRLVYGVEGKTILSFAAELYRVATSKGIVAHPLPGAAEILINFRGGPRTFPWIPYDRVVRGEFPPEMVRGKIVLVGFVDPLSHDLFPTPFARSRGMAGIEIHANALDTLVSGDRILEFPRMLSPIAAIGAALIGAWVVARFRQRSFLVGMLALVAIAASTFMLFAFSNTWFRSVAVVLAFVVGFMIEIMLTVMDTWRSAKASSSASGAP